MHLSLYGTQKESTSLGPLITGGLVNDTTSGPSLGPLGSLRNLPALTPPMDLFKLISCSPWIYLQTDGWPLTDRPNEVWGKVMFSQVFFCPRGAGTDWYPSMLHRSHVQHLESLHPGGVGQTPSELEKRAVHIVLECFLVEVNFVTITVESLKYQQLYWVVEICRRLSFIS